MDAVVIENNEPEGANVTTEVQQTPAEKVEEVGTEKTESTQVETPKEDLFEFEGEKLSKAELKEALDARKNKTEWQKSNTQKAQENAEEKRRLETERARLQEAEFMASKLRERPELLQKVFAPEQQRDYSAELAAHYAQRPTDPYDPNMAAWELKSQQLLIEQIEAKTTAQTEARLRNELVRTHNEKLEKEAFEKFKTEGVTESDMARYAQWIVSNLRADNLGRYSTNAFDLARLSLDGQKRVEQARLDAAQTVTRSMERAKPASGVSGASQKTETKTESELLDDAFVAEVNARKVVR